MFSRQCPLHGNCCSDGYGHCPSNGSNELLCNIHRIIISIPPLGGTLRIIHPNRLVSDIETIVWLIDCAHRKRFIYPYINTHWRGHEAARPADCDVPECDLRTCPAVHAIADEIADPIITGVIPRLPHPIWSIGDPEVDIAVSYERYQKMQAGRLTPLLKLSEPSRRLLVERASWSCGWLFTIYAPK